MERWGHEDEARSFDETEHPLSEMRRVEVSRAKPGEAKHSLAVRFDPEDIDRLRERAESEGVGVTQLVRTWVLDRLDEPAATGDVVDLMAALEASLRAAEGHARALKRSSTRKIS